jgi:argininosuccinate lyase
MAPCGGRVGVDLPDAGAASAERYVCAKLPSGYHRDLQLLKFPLFRGIDLATATLAILPAAIDALTFRPDAIRLDPAIHAAEEANRLVVTEGIPFREAYRRVAAKLKG